MERPDELSSNPEVQHIKAEISETQAELQQTVAEIQDRLSPAHIKQQAADTVREAATNVRHRTVGRVQHMTRGQNPIPFALIGIGAAWLIANNRSSRRWSDSEYDGEWGSSEYISSDDEFASPYAGDVDATLGVGADTGSVGRNSRLAASRERMSELSHEARDRARYAANRARTRWDSMLNDNPMALGIAALAAGALVGAALPQTEIENEYVGETRDNVVDSAKSMAQTAVGKTVGKVTGIGDQGQSSNTGATRPTGV
jgi:hypothetical protein